MTEIMETVDINPNKVSLLATSQEGTTRKRENDEIYDMATGSGTEKSSSDDCLQNTGTDFEEVELNFSKDCFRIKLVSLRTQSDSDLDTDVHSQQVHVKYTCKEGKTNDPERYSEESVNSKCHSNESEDVVLGRVDSPRVNVVLGKFTDMKSMLKQVLVSEHLEIQPKSEADGLVVTNQTPETDHNISGTEENMTEQTIGILSITENTQCVSDTVSSVSDITKVGKNTAKPDTDEEKKEAEAKQPGSDDESKEARQAGSEEIKEMMQPGSGEDRNEATQSQRNEFQKEPPWKGGDEENKEAAHPGSDEVQKETAQSENEEEKTEAEEPGNAEEKQEAPYIDNDEEQKETTQSNADVDDEDDDIEALMTMLYPDLILQRYNDLDLDLFVEDGEVADDEEEFADREAQLRQNYDVCQVCLEICRVDLQFCCQFKICRNCFTIYLEMKISEGMVVQIQCPNFDCQRQLSEYEVSSHLSRNMKVKYLKFLTDARQDPTEKTCPRCGSEQRMDKKVLKKKTTVKKGLPVTCQTCSLHWCFICQAPWHEGVTCKEYKKGDSEFRRWTQEHDDRQANAQKCPVCKVYIQRSSGCSHMTCPRCSTDFCYDCGGRYYPKAVRRRVSNSRVFRMLLGTHHSRLGLLGCSHNFLSQSNAARRVVRGTVFGAKLVGGACALAVGVGVATVVVVVAPAVWGTVKVRKKIREHRRNRACHH